MFSTWKNMVVIGQFKGEKKQRKHKKKTKTKKRRTKIRSYSFWPEGGNENWTHVTQTLYLQAKTKINRIIKRPKTKPNANIKKKKKINVIRKTREFTQKKGGGGGRGQAYHKEEEEEEENMKRGRIGSHYYLRRAKGGEGSISAF